MLDHVCDQQRIKLVWLSVLGGSECLSRYRGATACIRNPDGLGIVVNAHAVATQMQQVAPYSAADIESAAELESTDVPSIGSLHVNKALPARISEGFESPSVGVASRVVRVVQRFAPPCLCRLASAGTARS